MSNGSPLAPLRFFTDASPSWQGSNIRIEWDVNGVTQSTCGLLDESDGTVNWQYGEPPDALVDIAIEAARYGSEYAVAGAEHMGSETFAQMDAQCAQRCCGCGVVQGSIQELSEQGHCSRCFIALMGAA